MTHVSHVVTKRALVFSCACLMTACKDLLPPDTASSLSASEVQSLASQIASVAVNGANTGSHGSAARATGNGLVPQSSTQIFQQFSQRTNCETGGYAVSAGHVSGTISTSNLGTLANLSLQASDSFVGWTCDGGWVVNGDPYIGDSGTITVTGTHSSFSFTQGGGFVATRNSDGARVSCQVHMNIVWDNLTNGSATGYVTCAPGGTFTVSFRF